MVNNKLKQERSPSLTEVLFTNIEIPFTLRNKRNIAHWVIRALEKENKAGDYIHYNFCSDLYLLVMNRKYLQHDTYTDIITFDLSENGAIAADIYISIDRVRENANTHKTSFRNELHRVIIHGLLHVCGYSDKTPTQQALMRKKEDYYLSLLP